MKQKKVKSCATFTPERASSSGPEAILRMKFTLCLFLFSCTCITINNGHNDPNPIDTLRDTTYFAAESSLSGSVKGTIGETRKVYYVGHAHVDSGETLRVLPGTSVLADSRVDSATAATKKARLDVYGTLLLVGTAEDSIVLGNSALSGNQISGWQGLFAGSARISVAYTRFEPTVNRMEISQCQCLIHSSLVLVPIVPSFGNKLFVDSSRIYRRLGGEMGYPGREGNILSSVGNIFVYGPLAAAYENTLLAPGGTGDSAYIAYNIFYSTTSEPSEAEYTGIWAGAGCIGVIVNNTFWVEIPFRFPSPNMGEDPGAWTIRHNIVIGKRVGSGNYSYTVPGSAGFTVAYNNFWRSVNSGKYLRLEREGADTTLTWSQVNTNDDSCDAYYNISKDPFLVDHTTFALQDSSPCIGAGEGGMDMGAVPYLKP